MRSLKISTLTILLLTWCSFVSALRPGSSEDVKADLPVGRVVVLMIPAELIAFENVGTWSGRMNFSTMIAPLESGRLIVGGRSDWKASGSPLLAEVLLVKVSRKAKYNEVELRNQFVNVKLRFSLTISDLGAAFREVAFVGTLQEFQATDYFKTEIRPRLLSSRIPAGSSARTSPTEIQKMDVRVDQIITRAEDYFRKGKLYLQDNKRERARDEFDNAVDTILESGLDVRASQRLQTFYLELVERVYREEVPQMSPSRELSRQTEQGAPLQTGFRAQQFEASPLDQLSKLILTPEEPAFSGATGNLAQIRVRNIAVQNCDESRARKARLRGFHLGMSAQQVKVNLPGLWVPPANRFGYARSSIQFGPQLSKPSSLRGVQGIIFDFLDGKVSYIAIGYDNSIKWNSIDEFVERVSNSLGAPKRWEAYSYTGNEQRILQCGSLRFMAIMGRSRLGSLPALFLSDDVATEQLQRRKDLAVERILQEEEAQRRKKLQEEERKRRAFKP